MLYRRWSGKLAPARGTACARVLTLIAWPLTFQQLLSAAWRSGLVARIVARVKLCARKQSHSASVLTVAVLRAPLGLVPMCPRLCVGQKDLEVFAVPQA